MEEKVRIQPEHFHFFDLLESETQAYSIYCMYTYLACLVVAARLTSLRFVEMRTEVETRRENDWLAAERKIQFDE